ncbi:hypothetical protein SNE40_010702 [Patella caerulea]|uniref:Glutamate decarboxylase n=1 Tax=Patella caerulea TaxID=87958 RepID=A0AAN8K1J9_PATCE
MAFDCGMFQKLKKTRNVQEPRDLNSQLPEKSSDVSTARERRNMFYCKSPDWSEFEGSFSRELLESKNSEKLHRFLIEISHILTDYITKENDRASKVLDFHHPHQLREMMDHCLDIDENPRDLEQILSDCKETLKYCVRTGHPRFFNQLSTGLDVIGVAGEWLTAVSNTNMFTYEVAPVFTLMEEVILKRMMNLIGWEHGDGIFAPGGAVSNLYAVLLARQRYLPQAKLNGMNGCGEAVVFTSKQSHYSIKRAAVILGIGSNNVIYIDCDQRGKMLIKDLEDKILAAKQSGKIPLLVNGMAGTTVLGVYDPLEEIGEICEKYGIWFHVDGAWGGSSLLSRDHRHLLHGIERADSMTWNPHKMMGVPLQCSAILTKHKGVLEEANQMNANYLFQKDKNYDTSYDTGDKTIQCGRHNDVFKLWLMWRAKGDAGFEDQLNKNFDLSKYMLEKVRVRDGFHLVIEEIEAPNVCFWYIPLKWRSLPFSHIEHKQLNKIAPLIKAQMMESGTMLIQYQPLGELPNFFRVAMSNPVITTRDLDFLLDEIDCLGKDL